MSRHAQRDEPVNWSVIGTVGLVLVLLAVAATFLVARRPWEPPVERAAAVSSPTTSPGEPTPSTVKQSKQPRPLAKQHVRPPHQRVLARDKVLKRKTLALLKGLVTLPTTFRVSTFNVLGYSHTASGGDRRGWAPAATRMHWATSMLNGAGVDVVGFQEFQGPQFNVFRSITGGSFEVYPGLAQGTGPVQNSIAWRTDRWELVQSHMVMIPYFAGNMRPMPYVQLQNIVSGQKVWFINVHNPADKFGSAVRWRDQATAIESDLVNQLHADGTPVILTGDLNDRERAFCSLTSRTTLEAANGGSSSGGCAPPVQPAVDWIFGSSEFDFTTYVKQQDGLIRRTTDHPFVWAEVHLDPAGTR